MPLRADRFLHAIYEASPDAIVVADQDRCIVALNAAFTDLFGYTLDELEGKKTKVLYATPGRFEVEGALQFNAETSSAAGATRIDYKRKDGSVFPSATTASQVREGEQIVGFLEVIRDISDIVHREEIGLAERTLWQRLYEETPAIMHSIDGDGVIRHVSAAWVRRFGYARDEAVGRRSGDFLTPESRARAAPALKEFWREGQCHRMPHDFVAKSGEIVEVELSAFLQEVQGEMRMLAFLDDVTERNQTLRQLERSNQALAAFASVASHDLRAPLRQMSIFSEILSASVEGDESASRAAERIRDGARRMQTMIDKLLEFSRSAYQHLEVEAVDLEDIVADVRHVLASPIEHAQAQIDHGPLPKVRADRELLTRVLQNLVDNALKYRGAERPEIRIETARANGHWRIAVVDNGRGIPASDCDRVFEASHKSQDGLGIGLPLCRTIVESHGGKIWIDGQLASKGTGTKVVFTIPSEGMAPATIRRCRG